MTDPIAQHLKPLLSKDLVIDLEDRIRAEARKAFEMVRDRSGLDKRRARSLEGQARFRMTEQGFEEVCALHGGHELDGGVMPGTDLKVFQPFMRFEVGGKGVILGLASMSEPKAIPPKNKSRLAGVVLNYNLSPRLNFDGKGAKVGDIFALLLIGRDREKAGQIETIAIGVVNSKYESYLFYEPLDMFLSGHDDLPVSKPDGTTAPTEQPNVIVSLKKHIRRFVPPEAIEPEKEEDGTEH